MTVLVDARGTLLRSNKERTNVEHLCLLVRYHVRWVEYDDYRGHEYVVCTEPPVCGAGRRDCDRFELSYEVEHTLPVDSHTT